jgi:hypothetical protein
MPPNRKEAPEARPIEVDKADPSPSVADDVSIAVAGTMSGQLMPSTETAPPPAIGVTDIAVPKLPAPSPCTPTPPATSTVIKKPLKLVWRKPTMIRSQMYVMPWILPLAMCKNHSKNVVLLS